MRTAPSLIDASVAEAPVPFVALATFPKALVRWGVADVAKEPDLHPTSGVVVGHLFAIPDRALRGSRRWAIFERRQPMLRSVRWSGLAIR